MRPIVFTLGLFLLAACGADNSVEPSPNPSPPPGMETPPPDPETPPPPPVYAAVLLRDVVRSGLPSPYYHFDYDGNGLPSAVSFASGLRSYQMMYADGRISELRNNAGGNHDRLEYAYDAAGRVSAISFFGSEDVLFRRVQFSYAASRLTGVRWERRIGTGLVPDRTMTLSYYPDGNLEDLVDHRLAITLVQDESTVRDHYQGYDDMLNVDGFTLLHPDFGEHLFLLPGVTLQLGNPARAVRSGDGTNFTVDYRYTYDAERRPTSIAGTVTITNGSTPGQVVQIGSQFTYY